MSGIFDPEYFDLGERPPQPLFAELLTTPTYPRSNANIARSEVQTEPEIELVCLPCDFDLVDPHGDVDNTFDLALEELQSLLLRWHLNQANLECAAAFGLFETEERREIRATCQTEQKKLLSSLSPLAKEVLEGRHVVELGSVVVLANIEEDGNIFVEAVESLMS